MERTEQDRRGLAAITNFASTLSAWLLWVAVCGMAYWGYWGWAGGYGPAGRVSIVSSLIYWSLALVVMPILIYRSRAPVGVLLPPALLLSTYYLMILGAIGP